MKNHIPSFAAVALCCVGMTEARATAIPGAMTYAVIGVTDPNKKLPVLNGVPGAGVSNISMALPVRTIVHGYPYTVMIGSQNFSFNGSCIVSYNITSSSTGSPEQLFSGSTYPTSCAATAVHAWPFPTPMIPNRPGAATLNATIVFGSTVINQSVPLTIQ